LMQQPQLPRMPTLGLGFRVRFRGRIRIRVRVRVSQQGLPGETAGVVGLLYVGVG